MGGGGCQTLAPPVPPILIVRTYRLFVRKIIEFPKKKLLPIDTSVSGRRMHCRGFDQKTCQNLTLEVDFIELRHFFAIEEVIHQLLGDESIGLLCRLHHTTLQLLHEAFTTFTNGKLRITKELTKTPRLFFAFEKGLWMD